MESSRAHFHWLDYVLFSLMLLISCGMGIYYAVKAKKGNKEEYLMGSREMSWFPVAISLVVTYTSGITQMGKPAEVYQYGIQYIMSIFGLGFGVFVPMVTFVPLLFRLKLTSAYEYLELRFQSKAVRRVGSFTFVIAQLFYSGLATYTPAIAMEAVTGFPISASMLCIGAVATFYTMLGGIRAVVSTDAFQASVMLVSIISIIIFGIVEMGGMKNIWEINREYGRLNFFNFDPNPMARMTFWSLLAWKFFSWMPQYSVNQSLVQRISCVPSLKKAQRMVLFNIPSLILTDVAMTIIGLIIFSYFSQCDPLTHPDPKLRISSPNQLVPVFVMSVMTWPGLPGVFLASIFSGSLSTVSSCLNALAAITWEDFLRWKFDFLSEGRKTSILKGIVLVYGIGAVVFAFLVSTFRGHIVQVAASFMETANGPMMGLFILGAFFRRTNWLGAIAGCVIGLAFSMWISLGSYLAVSGYSPLPTSTEGCAWNSTSPLNVTTMAPVIYQKAEGINKLYTISFAWYPLIAILTTVFVGLIVSAISAPFLASNQPDDVKDTYLIFALDSCLGPQKTNKKAEKLDAVFQTELNELQS